MNKKILSILMLIFVCSIFVLCFKTKYNFTNNTYFAVVPHFSISESTVNYHYKLIKERYNLSGDDLNILIISPDHYKAWNNNIKLKNIDKNLCYKSQCIDVKWIYLWKDEKHDNKYIKEHGWWEHFFYINKYFSGANLYLAKLEPRNFFNIKKILSKLSFLEKKWDLLVLASVDFSHYVEEDWANLHDIKTKYTMNNSINVNDYKNIEVDCPACLYITNLWALEKWQYPNFIYRDSSSTINNQNLWFDNTSRQRYLYGWNKSLDNGITLAFFWDLIFDRWVKKKLKDYNKLVNHFSGWYHLWDTNKNPKYNIHRKWFWIDFVGFNLETPYINGTWSFNKRLWSLSFYSSGELLTLLSALWFNVVNIANNHTLDLWISWYVNTKKELTNNNFDYFWYIQTNSVTENNIVEKNIRWINVAFHWYNFYNRFSWDVNIYCDVLNEYNKNNFINIVSVHWWNEYENKHNILQEKIGKKLIDCWADAIIWHHPHVIQEIEWYKNKPIIYSLGNFLFDQYSEQTNRWLYVLIDINSLWKIQLWTWDFWNTP